MQSKKIKRISLFCLAGTTLFAACENSATGKTELPGKDTAAACIKPANDVNPNGTSELAALMRDMYSRSQDWKKAVENNEDLGIYPVAFDRLKTAKPTSENIKNETFDPFADDFIRRTKELLAAPPDKRQEAFGHYTEGCMNCHTTMCPGPVKRIRLLKIQ